MKRKIHRRVMSLLLTIVMVLGIIVPTASAATTTTVDGVTYTLNTSAKTASVTTTVSGSVAADLIIPSAIIYNGTTYTVTGVDKYAFRNNTEVVNVVFPDTITTMGDNAFTYCSSVESVVLPAKLTAIPKYTFQNCTSLKRVVIPSGVKTINNYAFNNTYALEELALPAGLTTITGSKIFGGAGFRSISLPAGVKALGSSAFTSCKNLESFYMEGSLTAIPAYTFSDTKLKRFVIPETVTSIGMRAFYNCYDLKELYIACDYPSGGVSDSVISDLATLTVYISSKYAENWKPFMANYFFVNFEIIDEDKIPAISAPAAPESYGVHSVVNHAAISGLPETVAAGGSYSFTVTPDAGYSISSVTVNGTAVTPDDSGRYTVSNVSAEQTVAVSASGITHTVTVDGNAKIRVGSSSYTAYTGWAEGTDLTFTVTANTGYSVTGVTAEGGTLTANEDGSYTLSAPYTDTTIHVETAELSGWVVTFSKGNTTVLVDGKSVTEVEVEKGGSLSFSVVPNDHYAVATVMCIAGGRPSTLSATDGIYTINNISSNLTVNVITTAARYGVSVNCGEHVSSSPSTGSVAYGSTFSFALTFDEGYEPDAITTNSGEIRNGTTVGQYILSGADQTAVISVTAKVMEKQELDDQQKLLTFKYNTDGTATVSKCSADIKGEVTIPTTVQNGSYTYRVTEVGSSAFRSCADLTNVVIPEGVVKLGSYAFADCPKLTQIVIPSTVTTTGDYLFRGCVGMTTADIPATVTALGESTFYGCELLEKVTLHEGLTLIPAYTFFDCHALSSVTIPSTVTQINGYAFAATSIKELVLPEGLENLGGTERSGRVFQNCYALEKITLPKTLKIIRVNSFENCESLTEIQLPAGLEYLGDGVFFGCSALTEITIPDGITVLKSSLFALCSKLTKVNMSDNVTEIGTLAFSNCDSLETIKLPAKLEILQNNAFQSCDKLKSVTIPAGVKEIGIACFTVCKSLSSVTFEGNQLTEIGASAFASTSSLKSITLPDSLEVLGSAAFSGSGITSLHLPAGVRSADSVSQTMLLYPAPYCSSLTEITVDENNAYYKSVNGVLMTKKGSVLIQYPAGKADTAYQVPAGVQILQSSAFGGAKNLTSVTIPDSVTILRGNAFSGCTNIKAFEIPASVQTLNNYSLSFGSEITDDLGNTSIVTSLEALVFHGDIKNAIKASGLMFDVDTTTVYYPAGNASWEEGLEAAQAQYPHVHFVAYDEAAQNPMNVHTVRFTTDGRIDAMTTGEEPEVVTEVSVRETNSYRFTVSPAVGYAVAAVRIGETELTPDENGVYTVTPTEDTEISITAVEAYYQVQFVSADGLAKIYNGKTEVTGRTTRLQYGYSLTLTVVPDEHYEIAGVTLSAGTLTDNENGTYTVSDISEDAVFTVTAQEKHEHTYELSEHKDATCTEDGYDRYTCTGCGDTYDEVLAATGHDYEAAGHKDAACTDNGYDRYTCKNCGDTYDEVLAATGHDYQVTEHVDPANDADGYEVQVCSRCGDTVRTELPAAPCPSQAFTDVSANDWFHSAVDYAMANGLMNGVSSTSFDPNGTTTRAMLVTILYRSVGKPEPAKAVPFTDVRAGAWYANAVAWAYANGIVNGVSETEFAPDENVTREQAAAILYRFAALKGEDVTARADLSERFDDAGRISAYAADAMSWAVASGILNGDGTSLLPRGNATRAQMAAMLMRYLSR